MILLKAIGKTLLSILKWTLIVIACFVCLTGGIYLSQFPNIVAIVVIGILLIMCVLFIVFVTLENIKENYEKYVRQSKNPINTYHIQYYKIYEDYDDIEGKTKQQAIDSLYRKLAEVETDDSHVYKIDKITKVN